MRKIQLKQVLRNKRFVLFTIILPIGWYIFFYQLQKGVSPSILLGIAVFIGVIGNSLATFSKRIASDIGFYSFESRFTSYSVKNYLWYQSFVSPSNLGSALYNNSLGIPVVACQPSP